MPRHKPTTDGGLVIASLEAVDEALLELARIDREISLIGAAMNEQIEHVRAAADRDAAPSRAQRALLEAALATFATARKESLFSKAKSLKLMHGVIGFRASKEVKPLPKLNWSHILGKLKELAAKLKERELPACIRTTEKVNKDELYKLPEDLRAEVGVRVVPKDPFFYEIRTDNVAEKAA